MCEVTACVQKGDEEEQVMEAVEYVEAAEDGVTLINLFGEKVHLNASFKRFNANNSKMIFEIQ